jgi:hypothetical protein
VTHPKKNRIPGQVGALEREREVNCGSDAPNFPGPVKLWI